VGEPATETTIEDEQLPSRATSVHLCVDEGCGDRRGAEQVELGVVHREVQLTFVVEERVARVVKQNEIVAMAAVEDVGDLSADLLRARVHELENWLEPGDVRVA
jgi:hypothetical protein